MTLDAARPFYRLGSLVLSDPFREALRQFLHRKFAESGFEVEEADGSRLGPVDSILNSAEEVPYNVQLSRIPAGIISGPYLLLKKRLTNNCADRPGADCEAI
jgi:hypothetical protein